MNRTQVFVIKLVTLIVAFLIGVYSAFLIAEGNLFAFIPLTLVMPLFIYHILKLFAFEKSATGGKG